MVYITPWYAKYSYTIHTRYAQSIINVISLNISLSTSNLSTNETAFNNIAPVYNKGMEENRY